ncbi:MAG: xylulokinase [Syntrophales bacterium]
MKKLLMGIDIGSGGCKVTVIDTAGRIISKKYSEYNTLYTRPGWAEQNPADWEDSLVKTLALTFNNADCSREEIECITIGATTHTLVLLDKEGTVLRPAILWTDKRTIAEVEWLKEKHGEMIIDETLHMPNVNWTLPYLIWIRCHEPDVWEKVDKILMPKDYIRYCLTGILATDFMDAHGTMLFNVSEKAWSSKICKTLEIPMRILPDVLPATRVIGPVMSEAASRFGLREGIPVLVGTTDQACEAFGSGAIHVGSGILKLATAGNVAVVTEKAYPSPPRVYAYYHLVSGQWYTLAGTSSCAVAYRWLRDTFFSAESEDKEIYRQMDRMAAGVSTGSQGLLFHPSLQGALGDPYMRADFLGVISSHRKAHFVRSVLEGVAFSLYDCLQREEALGVKAAEFRLIGGGAQSPLWRRIICDLFGRPMLLPREGDSSFGTALLGGVGIGVFPDFETAVRSCVEITEEMQPSMREHDIYRQIFKGYHDSEIALRDTYHRIHQLNLPA